MGQIPIGPPISLLQGVSSGCDWAPAACSLGKGVNYLGQPQSLCLFPKQGFFPGGKQKLMLDLFGTGLVLKLLSMAFQTPMYTSVNPSMSGSSQMTPDSLVYSTSLNYNPTPASNPVILRTNPAVIPIECHYPRKDNVSSKAIKPTWVPFSSTLSVEERLGFSLHLMNDDWGAERPSNGFQLGEVMHIQADVSTGNHVALRLFVDSCVATLTPDRDSSPRYAVIDFNDDTTSAFILRRTHLSPGMIYITCHLKVTAAEQAPNSLNKACSFNKAVEGTRDICRCCETGNCGLLRRQSRRAKSLNRWREAEADVVVGPLFIMDAYKGSAMMSLDPLEAGKAASHRRWHQRVSIF
uniref:Zona pellucida sperm-binding protein 3 n=1 Tax=Gopherus evgoodei TaxID=1825980 RepID=A0A8C4YCX0_9SAUR